MIDKTSLYCDLKLEMVKQWVVQVYLFIFIFGSFITIILAVVILLKFYRRQFFGKSFKVLLFLLIVFTLIFNAALLTSTILTQHAAFFHELPCDNVFYAKDCYWALYPACLGLAGLVMTQFALSIERYFSSLRADEPTKENGSKGIVLSLLVIIISCVAVFLLLDQMDPLELKWHCAGIPVSVARRANILFSTLIGVDVLSVVVFGIVWRINIKNKMNGLYSISKTLHIDANLLVMRLFLPVVLIHFIMFSIYIIGMIIVRSLRDSMTTTTYSTVSTILYIVPICTLIQLLMFLSILKQEDRRKKKNLSRRLEKSKNLEQHRELYGMGLNLQWKLAAEVK